MDFANDSFDQIFLLIGKQFYLFLFKNLHCRVSSFSNLHALKLCL